MSVRELDGIKPIPHIHMASDITEMAANLDDYKAKLPSEMWSAAQSLVNAMHDFSELLLGDHVGEVYDQEENEEEELYL